MLKLDFLLFSNHSYVFLPCQALIVWGVWVCTTSLTPRPTLWKENGLRTQTYTYTHTHVCSVIFIFFLFVLLLPFSAQKVVEVVKLGWKLHLEVEKFGGVKGLLTDCKD